MKGILTMKNLKRIVPIIILLLVITSIIIIFISKNRKNYQNLYQKTIKLSDINEHPSFEEENIKVSLNGFYTNNEDFISAFETEDIELKNYTEKDINIVLEFSGQNNTFITELDYEYIVHDNKSNIIAFSPGIIRYETDFGKTFSKKMYNVTNFYEFSQHIISPGNQLYITSSNNRILRSIQINLDDVKNKYIELDLSKLHVLIVNPKYKDTQSSQFHNLYNTVFEYIIEN